MDKKVTPKDFFLWAGAMVALYGSVIALIALLFEYIDRTYPDSLEHYVDPYSGGIRFAMASLIVLVPVTIVLMRFIRNDIARAAEKAELWVRRWALVFTVFIAGAMVVGDLIALINTFLGGDLTTRFILKILVVLFVAGGGFLHFLLSPLSCRSSRLLEHKSSARKDGGTSGGYPDARRYNCRFFHYGNAG